MDVVTQPDGKIIGATVVRVDAVISERHLMFRLLENGMPDASYGSAGFRFHGSETTRGQLFAAAVQPDQKLLFFGLINPTNMFLARYNPDGSTDFAFGDGGSVAVPLTVIHNNELLRIDTVAGRVIVAATSVDVLGTLAVARYWL